MVPAVALYTSTVVLMVLRFRQHRLAWEPTVVARDPHDVRRGAHRDGSLGGQLSIAGRACAQGGVDTCNAMGITLGRERIMKL